MIRFWESEHHIFMRFSMETENMLENSRKKLKEVIRDDRGNTEGRASACRRYT